MIMTIEKINAGECNNSKQYRHKSIGIGNTFQKQYWYWYW